jgi:2-iminobutanoate/2-iminopropanoate deaminase
MINEITLKSQGIIAQSSSNLLYVSGQVPGIPGSSSSINRGSIGEQTDHCFVNIRAIVEAAGSSMNKIVKVNVFLSVFSPDPESGEKPQDTFDRKFKAMNEVYAQQFPKEKGPQPARSCVGVAVLPLGVDVEIECIALA